MNFLYYSLLIIFVNLLFYWRTLKLHLVCDDIPVYTQNVEIPKGFWMFIWYHLHGRKYTDVKFAHALTLFIHTLNCLLIYWVFGHNNVSMLAALLFSVNAVNNQCSIWISGKGYSQNLTYALLIWAFPYFSVIPYVFGLYFAGVSLILFPLVFLFTKYWYLSFLVLLGFYREKKRIFNPAPDSKFKTEGNKELITPYPRKYILLFKTYGYHFFNCLLNFRLGFYHQYLFVYGVNPEENKKAYKLDKFFYLGILSILITIVSRDIGLLWFGINLAMWTNFISFNQTITLRYSYLANAGLMLALAGVLIKFPVVAGMVFAYYATSLIKFIIFYTNEYYSIEWATLEQPDFFYTWQNRAIHCFQCQNFQGAKANMLKANELRPNDWKILYNLSQIALVMGHIDEAKKYFNLALQQNIDGREEIIHVLMERLKAFIDETEIAGKDGKPITFDLNRVDMQR